MSNEKDWNFDRIYSALALIHDVQNDMMRCIHSGKINDCVQDRMAERLRIAADQIKKTALCHD